MQANRGNTTPYSNSRIRSQQPDTVSTEVSEISATKYHHILQKFLDEGKITLARFSRVAAKLASFVGTPHLIHKAESHCGISEYLIRLVILPETSKESDRGVGMVSHNFLP